MVTLALGFSLGAFAQGVPVEESEVKEHEPDKPDFVPRAKPGERSGYNEKGVYEYAVEPWTDPDNPAVIELDKDDPTFELWRQRVPDPNRKPGLIQLQRYAFTVSNHGIPTFLNRHVALTPEDLKAAKVDVAIFGAAFNTGLNPGSAGDVWGPKYVRSNMDFIVNYADPKNSGFHEYETLIDPFETLLAVDYGDVSVLGLSNERSQEELRRMTYEIAEAGAIPVVVGGDHQIPYGAVSGVVDALDEGEEIAIVHFDAHHDYKSGGLGQYYHSGVYWLRLIENGSVKAGNIITIGNNTQMFSKKDYQEADAGGMKRFPLYVLQRDGMDKVLKDVLKELAGIDKIYLSVDIDVFNAAYAPATGSSELTGLTPNEGLPFMRKLAAHKEVVGFDVVEYNPWMDNRGYQSARLVNRIMLQFLTGIAMKRQGIDPEYISPLIANPPR
jgi:agmatinase